MGEITRAVTAATLGEAWVGVAGRILDEGKPATYDGLPIVELAHVALDIARPDPDDPIIAAHGDPERLAWMRANFRDHARVAALGDADSYATRLYDYGRSGRDQIAWVIERLRPRAIDALRDDHYPPAAHRYELYPVHQPAGLLAPRRGAGVGRLCSQHRLWGEGLRQSGGAGSRAASRRVRAGCAGRAAGDGGQIRPYLCDGAGVYGRDRGSPPGWRRCGSQSLENRRFINAPYPQRRRRLKKRRSEEHTSE